MIKSKTKNRVLNAAGNDKNNGEFNEDEFSDEEISENTSSDSESESDDLTIWTANDEKDFLRTLSALKTRDPQIYENNAKFFNEDERDSTNYKEKSLSGPEKMTLKEYEQKVVLERGGHLSDEEDKWQNNEQGPGSSNWKDEKMLKEAFKSAINSSDDGSDSEELFKKRIKTEEEKKEEEEDYYNWLKGQSSMDIRDKNLQKLKERWSKDEELDEDEKFLRDYLLNKKYEGENDDTEIDRIPNYEEIIQEEEEEDMQDQFEHKYNFRFEEPDQEYLKQYPRTIKEALRQGKSTRKIKRSEKVDMKKVKKRKIEMVEMPFHYRTVVPNSFGLTTEEILESDDRKLNAWAPISKMSQYRNEEEEKRQAKYFERKANEFSDKKKKMLQSSSLRNEPAKMDIEIQAQADDEKEKEQQNNDMEMGQGSHRHNKLQQTNPTAGKAKRKKRKIKLTELGTTKKKDPKSGKFDIKDLGDERLKAYGVSLKKLKRYQYSKKMEQSKKK